MDSRGDLECAVCGIHHLGSMGRLGKSGLAGNVAVDCALTAKQQGAQEVTLFIRRKIFNMKMK